MANLTDKQFLRYHRHVMLEKIGEQGQLAFQNSRVLIIGMGGLGCPAAQYLTAAGIGTLTLVDHDTIETSNLQRQILYSEANIGEKKAIIAQKKLAAQNSLITINAIAESIFNLDLASLIQQHDVILDCTDNVKTRRLINSTCRQFDKQLVSASAIQASGQLISFDFAVPDSPCYECLFPESVEAPQNCSTAGVFSPVLGVLGSLQATETLRLILGEYNNLNQLMLFDAWGMATQKFKLNRRSDCPVCAG